jgi:hypothetical protein
LRNRRALLVLPPAPPIRPRVPNPGRVVRQKHERNHRLALGSGLALDPVRLQAMPSGELDHGVVKQPRLRMHSLAPSLTRERRRLAPFVRRAWRND